MCSHTLNRLKTFSDGLKCGKSRLVCTCAERLLFCRNDGFVIFDGGRKPRGVAVPLVVSDGPQSPKAGFQKKMKNANNAGGYPWGF
ncbi:MULTISPECIES: hypothetical protein [unclassified Neisseria]|uniref:hypothetical protein n=1 Tax=unclassified Neisseria TaxID=2623750 RepID=UPI0010724F47|nr:MULTISPECIES: hypothetical protein [unclassified Neisseria]